MMSPTPVTKVTDYLSIDHQQTTEKKLYKNSDFFAEKLQKATLSW